MKIYRPVKTNWKTQGFGESLACAKLDPSGKVIRPFKITSKSASATCPVGTIDFYSGALGMMGHNGEDWSTKYKEDCHFPVEADTDWFAMTEVDKDGGIGIDVCSTRRILIDELPAQAGPQARAEWEKHDKMLFVKFRFWHHQSSLKVNKEGVRLGEKIGLCDSTGASGGDHLHWSMKFVSETGKTLDANNGYTGAVDFSHWFVNIYILDELKKREAIQNAVTSASNVVKESTKLPLKDRLAALSGVQKLLEGLLKLLK